MINPLLNSIEEGRESEEAKFQDYDEVMENRLRQKIPVLMLPENF